MLVIMACQRAPVEVLASSPRRLLYTAAGAFWRGQILLDFSYIFLYIRTLIFCHLLNIVHGEDRIFWYIRFLLPEGDRLMGQFLHLFIFLFAVHVAGDLGSFYKETYEVQRW